MTYTISSKKQAIKLRAQGKSYNEINKLLGVPKSTLSTWLKDNPLSEKIKKININRAKIVWAKNIVDFNKKRSEKYQKDIHLLMEKFAREIPMIADRDLFFIGLALFWAEGGKREKYSVRFANSDPTIIKAIMCFFRKICHTDNKKVTLRIHLYPNVEEIAAKKYWSKITGLSLTQFRKSQTKISKSSKHKRPINRLPYGTLHITIGDAYLNKKLKGWILGLSQQFNNMPG